MPDLTARLPHSDPPTQIEVTCRCGFTSRQDQMLQHLESNDHTLDASTLVQVLQRQRAINGEKESMRLRIAFLEHDANALAKLLYIAQIRQPGASGITQSYKDGRVTLIRHESEHAKQRRIADARQRSMSDILKDLLS